MKQFYTLVLSLFCLASASAQIFESNLSSWSNGMPTDFGGSRTNLDSIVEVTGNSVFGTSAAQLVNEGTSGKRFTTQAVSVTEGTSYEISAYVKGTGTMGFRLYTDKYVGSISYIDVDASGWEQVTATVTSDLSTDSAEVLFYAKNTSGDHLQIDYVKVEETQSNEVSIYDIQYTTADASPLEGQVVETKGIVTAIQSSGRYYIQDGSGPWNGIYVYDRDNEVELGDEVKVTAQVVEYFTLTELTGIAVFEKLSTGNALPTPVEVSVDEAIEEKYEGVYVTIKAAEVMTPEDDGTWEVSNGNNNVVVSDFMNEDSFTLSQGDTYDITGIMDYFKGRQILPRDGNDVSMITSVNENIEMEVNVYPNPVRDVLNIKMDKAEAAVLEINAISGELVKTVEIGQSTAISVSELHNGIYILTVKGKNGKKLATKRMVIAE